MPQPRLGREVAAIFSGGRGRGNRLAVRVYGDFFDHALDCSPQFGSEVAAVNGIDLLNKLRLRGNFGCTLAHKLRWL